MSVEDVLEILAVDLIGAILDDEQIVISTNQGEPLSGKILRQKKSIAISAGGLWAKKSLMLLSVGKMVYSTVLAAFFENKRHFAV